MNCSAIDIEYMVQPTRFHISCDAALNTIIIYI